MFYKIIIFLVAYVATIMVRYRAGSQNRVVTSEPVLLVGEVPARRFFPHFYESILDPGAPIPYTDGLLQCLSVSVIPKPQMSSSHHTDCLY